MDDQSVYINQLQEDLEAKIEQIEKLEGWLKYLWRHYLQEYDEQVLEMNRIKECESEISDYIKEAKS